MVVHRFCSEYEYDRFMRGESLVNNCDHGLLRGKEITDSVGFCFFTQDPDWMKHRLSGIVDFDYCLTFEVPDGCLVKSRARYVDYSANGTPLGSVFLEEYCCKEYSRDVFRLISARTDFRGYAMNASELRLLFPQWFL